MKNIKITENEKIISDLWENIKRTNMQHLRNHRRDEEEAEKVLSEITSKAS